MASRLLGDLKTAARENAQRMLDAAGELGFEILIYCTYRSDEEQARLYRQGRPLSVIQKKADDLNTAWERPDLAQVLMEVGPQYGRVVTHAAPGQSLHEYGVAFDGVPMLGGKPVWNDQHPDEQEAWELYGRLGTEAGLTWAGNWQSFKEKPHMQVPGFDWRDLIRGGRHD